MKKNVFTIKNNIFLIERKDIYYLYFDTFFSFFVKYICLSLETSLYLVFSLCLQLMTQKRKHHPLPQSQKKCQNALEPIFKNCMQSTRELCLKHLNEKSAQIMTKVLHEICNRFHDKCTYGIHYAYAI